MGPENEPPAIRWATSRDLEDVEHRLSKKLDELKGSFRTLTVLTLPIITTLAVLAFRSPAQ